MLVAGDYLKPRQPSRKAKNVAQELKRIYVSNLASELGIQKGIAAVDLVLSSTKMEKPVALATYGAELIRRSRFASQGEGELVLWREFAWDEGRLKKGFQLSAERILAAEREICDFLRTAA